MPVMLRATPNRRAIASPASTASTTGSTKSSEMTTKNNCVETEVMMLGSSRLSPDLEGWRFQRKDVRVERIRLETAPSRSWGAEAKRCHVTEPAIATGGDLGSTPHPHHQRPHPGGGQGPRRAREGRERTTEGGSLTRGTSSSFRQQN